MQSIAIVIPFYYCFNNENYSIISKLFKHYSDMDVEVFGVGSEGNLSKDLFCRFFPEKNYLEFTQDWTYVPSGGCEGLTRKYNTSLEFVLKNSTADFISIVGSDDFISKEFFANFSNDSVTGISGDYYMMYGPKWGVFESQKYCDIYGIKFSSGAGLTFPRHVLEKLGFDVFGGMDEVTLEPKLHDLSIEMQSSPNIFEYCVYKTDQNINTFTYLSDIHLLKLQDSDNKYIEYLRDIS
jgi:hypothetical protein